MKARLAMLFALAVLAVAIFGKAPVVGPPTYATAIDRTDEGSKFAGRVLTAASPARTAKWESLRSEVYAPPEVALELFYSTPPSSTEEAKRDTESVARAALEVLQADGRRPAKDMIMVWVYALQRVKGETGTDRLVTFGKARYHPLKDSISFEAPQQ